MARPVGARNKKGYKRDLESLNRLRMSLLINPDIDRALQGKAISHIDSLSQVLIVFTNGLDEATE